MRKNLPDPNDSPRFSPELEDLKGALRGMSSRVSRLEERISELERTRTSQPELPPVTARPGAGRVLESRTGLAIVNRVGALTLALGIIFFFKYAVDSRWIGAEARVALGLFAGATMLGGAEWLRRKAEHARSGDQRLFLQGLAGCGLATVYVAIYAAYGYYQLIIPGAGFLFLVAASALGVLLSIRYASAAIAGLGLTGALLAPLLLDAKAEQIWLDLPLLLLAGVTAVVLAVRQNWPVLIPVIASLDVVAGAILFGSRHGGWFVAFAVLLAALHFAAAANSKTSQPAVQSAYIAGHGLLLIGSLRAVAMWSEEFSAPANRGSVTSEVGSVLLALYGAGLLSVGLTRGRPIDRLLGMAFLGLVMTKLYLWDIWQLGRFYRITAFVALGVVLLGASFVYSRLRSQTPDP